MKLLRALLPTSLLIALLTVACDPGSRPSPPPDAPPAQDAILVVTGGGLTFAPGPVIALGLQWTGLPIARAARAVVPDLPILHTETDCGNHYWESGFDPDRPQNDWAYALHTWQKMRGYFKGGAVLYTLWNLVLDETGKSIDAILPWPQSSPVVVDRAAQKAIYTPMYFAVAHFTRYTGAGAVRLDGHGTGNALAFRRPDGLLAVVLVNPASYPEGLRVKVGEKAYCAELPAHTFATLLVAP